MTKKDYYPKADAAFRGTGVHITTDGRPYLGVPIGTEEYIQSFLTNKVNEWSEEMSLLATIAQVQPQAAYAAFTHGLTSKWLYLSRTMKDISSSFQPLEQIIRTKLIPALTGKLPPNDIKRNLLSYPARLGSVALANPSQGTNAEFIASNKITEALQKAIIQQDFHYTSEIEAKQLEAKKDVHKLRLEYANGVADRLRKDLPQPLKWSMQLAQESGASSWLTSLPIEEFGFTLHKRAFQDALALRYNWKPLQSPSFCECGASFSIKHSLSCPKGGFPSIRHNEMRSDCKPPN